MKTALNILIFLISSFAFSQHWNTDFEAAMATAKATNKPVLLVFSGSDWCAPCVKLDQQIFTTEVFKAESDRNWILVKADFPKKKAHALPEVVKIQNDKLAEKYNHNGNFPFVLLLDSNGKVLGRTGFKNNTPEAYIAELKSFEQPGS